jgi:membrane-bound ClpP family serine protease
MRLLNLTEKALTLIKCKIFSSHTLCTGKEGMIGSACNDVTQLSPNGIVKYNVLWRAKCVNGWAKIEKSE